MTHAAVNTSNQREVIKVLVAQFLTAFADNAVMFVAITMVFEKSKNLPWYIPALQASFLVAFVLLAPWVGFNADTRPKPNVMWQANLIKAFGALLLFINIEPLLAYAVIGIGASMYSPAKYGILPELVSGDLLVKANGWIEGSTILAIVSGTYIGTKMANHSIHMALSMVMACFICSAAMAFLLRKMPAAHRSSKAFFKTFLNNSKIMLSTPRARFSTLAVSLFWASVAVLRVLLFAWVPLVLLINDTTEIAELSLFSAIGIAVGAVIVPHLIPLAYLRRARMAAYCMGFMIIVLSQCSDALSAKLVLTIIGLASGMFVVPINAALQDIGHKSVGSGAAVALQNFFENMAMLLATAAYSIAAAAGANPIVSMVVLGFFVVIATVIISWHLPKDPIVQTADSGGVENQ